MKYFVTLTALLIFSLAGMALAEKKEERVELNFRQYQMVVQVGDYKIPVQATPAWNPNAKHAFMEVAINFF